jgi:hypothetical protein
VNADAMQAHMRTHQLGTCSTDASSKLIAQRTKEGKGCSPSPSVVSVVRNVWSILDGGLASLDLNDYGRPWPPIRRSSLVALCSRFPDDLCLKAAWEAREIVQSQDRAPNITGLYAKKLAELAEARATVREAVEGAA